MNKNELEKIIFESNPIVICLSETHITSDIQKSEISIPGYKCERCDSLSRHTGGVLLYIKINYKYSKVLHETMAMNLWILGIKITINNKPYTVIALYHSPSASNADFINRMENILDNYNFENSTIIVIGDFNIDISKNSFYKEKLLQSISRVGLHQIINQFTRVTENSSTIIDLILTNNKSLKHTIHLTPCITDHLIITINLEQVRVNSGHRTKIRDYKNFKEIDFQIDLLDTNWTFETTNINTLSDLFLNQIVDTLNKHAPNKIISVGASLKGWWCDDIKNNIKERDTLFKRATITRDENDWVSFKTKRNEVVSLIRKYKREYYNNKIDECRHDSKEMWRTLKELIKGRNDIGRNEIIFDDNVLNDEYLICESFNSFFLDSLNNILHSIQKHHDNNYVLRNIQPAQNTLNTFNAVDMASLKKSIHNMPNKGSDINGITTKVLKLAFDAVGNRLLDILNVSLRYGVVPKEWKVSTIVPVEKKENTLLCQEFRPINTLPPYEKLLEILVKEQLLNYVEDNDILSIYQAGFRKQNSCETALQTVMVRWLENISAKKHVGVVFLDYRRAFEMIDRGLLLKKLEKIGIQGVVLQWFNSYLSERYQVVKYNNSVSNRREVIHGVPQGSVLGPILFILYINDVVKVPSHCQLQLFADDVLLYVTGDNIGDIINNLNIDLAKIKLWSNENNLSINLDKTKFMLLTSKYNNNIDPDTTVKIDDCHIERVSEYKYLGVIIDQNLTFSNHANYILKKISKKIYFFRRISKNLSTWTKLLIYKTIILPHFTYCPTILFTLYNTELNMLQVKQNLALRTILNSDIYTRVNFMLDSLNLLSVKQNLMLNVFIFLFKLLNNLLPQHLLHYCTFVYEVHEYHTRHRDHFYIERTHNRYGENQLFIKGLKLYNNLPNTIKNCNSLIKFKNLCMQYVKDTWPI